MLYCEKCQKEVIIVGEGSLAGMDDEVEEWEKKIEKQGKLILYDPPPNPPYLCPKCGSDLIVKH